MIFSLDPIAVYAAVVATGALALEIRRWFESGTRLRLNLMVDAMFVGGPTKDDTRYIHLSVTNVGDRSTTVNVMLLRDYKNLWNWLLRRSIFDGVIPKPYIYGSPNVPALIGPGEQWSGFVTLNDQLRQRLIAGHLYVGVATSHKARPSFI